MTTDRKKNQENIRRQKCKIEMKSFVTARDTLTSMDHHNRDGLFGGEIAINPIPGPVGFPIDCKRNGAFRCGCRRFIVQVAIGGYR